MAGQRVPPLFPGQVPLGARRRQRADVAMHRPSSSGRPSRNSRTWLLSAYGAACSTKTRRSGAALQAGHLAPERGPCLLSVLGADDELAKGGVDLGGIIAWPHQLEGWWVACGGLLLSLGVGSEHAHGAP
jgi:hypothetical protein